jgi:hypothetical protein
MEVMHVSSLRWDGDSLAVAGPLLTEVIQRFFRVTAVVLEQEEGCDDGSSAALAGLAVDRNNVIRMLGKKTMSIRSKVHQEAECRS